MIRRVRETDAQAIVDIYNEYVVNSTATFETEAVTVKEMSARIAAISSRYPYFVYEVEGKVVGYSYAHAWKERAAYRNTLETTVYVSPDFMRRGIGKALMIKLIDACRADGFQVLIACITEGNAGSIALHKLLGFKQVSHFERVGTKFDRRLDVSDFELILS